jgi:hypothetical protein
MKNITGEEAKRLRNIELDRNLQPVFDKIKSECPSHNFTTIKENVDMYDMSHITRLRDLGYQVTAYPDKIS